MANTSRPMGFKPQNVDGARCRHYVVTAGQVLSDGDMVSFDSSGTLVIGAGSPIAGVVSGQMIDYLTGEQIATATAGDLVMVYDDPNEVFIAQISEFTATDPYTTASSAACFDVTATTGAQYIEAGTHAQDAIKVLGLEWEENGKKSIAGVNAKVECRINGLKHAFGVTA